MTDEDKIKSLPPPRALAEINRITWKNWKIEHNIVEEWLDDNIGRETKYGGHQWSYGKNSDGQQIVKCKFCGFARMYLHLFEMTHCDGGDHL